MPELTYCSATQSDIPKIVGLCKELIDRYEDKSTIDYDRVMTWVGEKVRSKISEYTCVFHGREKVGYYHLTKDSEGWELDDLYILPAFRNQGIGSKVLQHCLNLVDEAVYLFVFTGNAGAIRLYERFGFSQTQRVGDTRMIMRRDG